MNNVNLNLLGIDTPDATHNVAPGGGYILTSGNSLAGYLLPENVLAMVETLQEHGKGPIQV